MTTIEPPPGIDPNDLAALQLAFSQCYAASHVRAIQLDSMLQDRSRVEVAEFAAYDQQIDNMRLRPWEEPPCHVGDPHEPRRGEEAGAKVLRRMLKAGISRWHPNPLAALEAKAS
jgi:hypothetical protein